jgi:hypothetical protein
MELTENMHVLVLAGSLPQVDGRMLLSEQRHAKSAVLAS